MFPILHSSGDLREVFKLPESQLDIEQIRESDKLDVREDKNIFMQRLAGNILTIKAITLLDDVLTFIFANLPYYIMKSERFKFSIIRNNKENVFIFPLHKRDKMIYSIIEQNIDPHLIIYAKLNLEEVLWYFNYMTIINFVSDDNSFYTIQTECLGENLSSVETSSFYFGITKSDYRKMYEIAKNIVKSRSYGHMKEIVKNAFSLENISMPYSYESLVAVCYNLFKNQDASYLDPNGSILKESSDNALNLLISTDNFATQNFSPQKIFNENFLDMFIESLNILMQDETDKDSLIEKMTFVLCVFKTFFLSESNYKDINLFEIQNDIKIRYEFYEDQDEKQIEIKNYVNMSANIYHINAKMFLEKSKKLFNDMINSQCYEFIHYRKQDISSLIKYKNNINFINILVALCSKFLYAADRVGDYDTILSYINFIKENYSTMIKQETIDKSDTKTLVALIYYNPVLRKYLKNFELKYEDFRESIKERCGYLYYTYLAYHMVYEIYKV